MLRLVAQGARNQEIAATLVLSVRTVERHVANIYDKIGLTGRSARAAAASYALSSASSDDSARRYAELDLDRDGDERGGEGGHEVTERPDLRQRRWRASPVRSASRAASDRASAQPGGGRPARSLEQVGERVP